MNTIIIDNYDSFTYNLYHILQPLVDYIEVVRNDRVGIESLQQYDKIVYSPGPGLPKDSSIMFDILKRYENNKSILGICLGHQAIIEFYGGKLTNLEDPLHGLTVPVKQTGDESILFKGIPKQFETGRYHSWSCQITDLPETLLATAIDDDKMVMALKHKKYNIHSMQYHPESVMTPEGKNMLKNWINLC